MTAGNLALYRAYYLSFDPGFVWPIKFLFQLQHLELREVLVLQAGFEILTVLLEVPSGFFSDRLGRKPTLMIAAGASFAGHALFGLAQGFWTFFAASALWAVTASFASGTDRAFHYDSLEALGREGEFQSREAALHRDHLLLQSTLAIAGGACAAFVSYRLCYFLAAAMTLIAVAATAMMTEPARRAAAPELGALRQLGDAARVLRRPVVLWLFAYAALAKALDHFPYQYYQPYLELLGRARFGWEGAPALSAGVHVCVTMSVGALIVGLTPRLLKRFRAWALLLAACWAHIGMIAAAAAFVHPAVAALLALRETINGVKSGLLAPMLLPHVARPHRATVLSLIGFGSRLAVGAAVFALAAVGAGGLREQMSAQLWTAAGISLLVLLALYATAPAEARR